MDIYKKEKSAVRGKSVFLFLLVYLLLSGTLVRSQTPDPIISKLFQNSYRVIDRMRLSGGIYLDALAINTGDKPAALAANGVGLISLCIADAMYKKTGDAVNWDSKAESKALKTINEWIRLKNTSGATNVNGLFHRYFDPSDGSWVWVTEHSTIDNAILATGFLFCRNYFNQNAEIVEKTTTLLNSMDFTAAIPLSGNQMYMILDDKGVGSAMVKPFNEYLVLAWWAKNSNPSFPGYNRAQTYWANYYSDANKLPKYNYPAGNPTLSEATTFAQPSFHVQFCLYYCNYFGNNTDYMTYFANQATADRTWWQNITGQQIAWGCGAGEIPAGGYSADAVNNNPNKIVSPHIMAGFSPVYPEVRNDLIALYNNGAGSAVYKIPNTDYEFLWRYKFANPTQRASYVQAVDFSTMLYGLAALPEYLGPDFFTKYNDFNFVTSATTLEFSGENRLLKIFPIPAKNQVEFQVDLPVGGNISIEIISANGGLIKQLINQKMTTGKHTIHWDVETSIVPGIYFCRMKIDQQTFPTSKLIITK
jgi:hypothetical protein